MKINLQKLMFIFALSLVLFSTGLSRAQEPTNPAAAVLKSHIMVTPQEIEWESCPPSLPPGAECALVEGDMKAADRLFAYRVKMPDGYKIAPHYHPADEHLNVVKGTFHMGLGDVAEGTPTHAMTAGSFAVMPKGAHHFARTEGETIVQVYAIGPWGLTYVNPKDDPRNK